MESVCTLLEWCDRSASSITDKDYAFAIIINSHFHSVQTIVQDIAIPRGRLSSTSRTDSRNTRESNYERDKRNKDVPEIVVIHHSSHGDGLELSPSIFPLLSVLVFIHKRVQKSYFLSCFDIIKKRLGQQNQDDASLLRPFTVRTIKLTIGSMLIENLARPRKLSKGAILCNHVQSDALRPWSVTWIPIEKIFLSYWCVFCD